MPFTAEKSGGSYTLTCGSCKRNIGHADHRLPALRWSDDLVNERKRVVVCDNEGCGARNLIPLS